MGLNVDPRVRTAMVSDSLDAVGVRIARDVQPVAAPFPALTSKFKPPTF